MLDGVSWRGELFAEGGGRVAGPFFVGAGVEAEEVGGELAAELEPPLLVPPLRGPSIAAVPGERPDNREVYGSSRICGGRHFAATAYTPIGVSITAITGLLAALALACLAATRAEPQTTGFLG